MVNYGYGKEVIDQAAADSSGYIAAGLETLAMGTSGLGTALEWGGALLGGAAGTLADGNPLLPIFDFFGVPAGFFGGFKVGNEAYRKTGLNKLDANLSRASTGFTILSDIFSGNTYSFKLEDKTVIVVGAASLFSTVETGLGIASPVATVDFGFDLLGFVYGWGSSPIVLQRTQQPISLYKVIGDHIITSDRLNLVVVLGEVSK